MRNIESTRNRRRRQGGQSMVEGALVLLVLLATILGVLDFGQMMFLHQTLTERARAAARYGGLHPTETAAVRNLVVWGRTTAPRSTSTGFWGLSPSNVYVTRVNPNTNEDAIVVTIANYRFQFFSLWIAGNVRGRPIVASSPVEST